MNTLFLIAIPALSLLAGVWIGYRIGTRDVKESYYMGVQDGQKFETEHAVRQALEDDRMARWRKLRDSGRRSLPREGAVPSQVKKVRLGPRRPNQGTM